MEQIAVKGLKDLSNEQPGYGDFPSSENAWGTLFFLLRALTWAFIEWSVGVRILSQECDILMNTFQTLWDIHLTRIT